MFSVSGTVVGHVSGHSAMAVYIHHFGNLSEQVHLSLSSACCDCC